MIITYDVFNENVGTVGRYKSLEEKVYKNKANEAPVRLRQTGNNLKN